MIRGRSNRKIALVAGVNEMSNWNSFLFVIGVAVSFVVLLWLMLRSGHGYSVHDTEAHAEDYGGGIREGHGGMTAMLWVLYIGILVWTIVYFVIRSDDFSVLFAH
jgi:hypothetical protein